MLSTLFKKHQYVVKLLNTFLVYIATQNLKMDVFRIDIL